MNSEERENIREFLSLLNPAAAEAAPQRITRWDEIPTAAQMPQESIGWLVEGIVPRGGVTLIAGESGTYKTWLALCLARSVATGLPFLERKCMQADVLYLDRENPAALMRERTTRLWMDGLSGFRLWGGWVADPPPMIGDARLLELARERKPLVVIDSFIRFHEQDENSASTMALVMNELRALANAGASVVVLHHKPKGDGSQYRGSSDIRAGVDVAFAVSVDSGSRRNGSGEDAAPTIRFAGFKNRLGPEFSISLRPRLECGGSTPLLPGQEAGTPLSFREASFAVDAAEKNADARQSGAKAPHSKAPSGRETLGAIFTDLPGFAVAASPHAERSADAVAKLRELITAHPGLSQRQIIAECGVKESRAVELLRQHDGKLWRVERGQGRSLCYFPVENGAPAPMDSREA